MALFSAYCDESGHPDDSKTLVVGGFIADVAQWVHLEREWRQALCPSDPANAPVFHLTDGCDEALKLQLANIIRRRVESSFATAVFLDDFRKMNHKYIFAEAFAYPYPLGARACVGEVVTWAERYDVHTPVEVVFEHGSKHRGQIEWVMERDRLPVPIYKKKTECLLLQPADLLVGELRRFLDARLAGKRVQSKVLDRLEDFSEQWGVCDLSDPDMLPYVFKIPRRNPDLKYESRIMLKGGRRVPVVHSWPRDERTPKLKKAVPLNTGQAEKVTLELANIRMKEYYERQS